MKVPLGAVDTLYVRVEGFEPWQISFCKPLSYSRGLFPEGSMMEPLESKHESQRTQEKKRLHHFGVKILERRKENNPFMWLHLPEFELRPSGWQTFLMALFLQSMRSPLRGQASLSMLLNRYKRLLNPQNSTCCFPGRLQVSTPWKGKAEKKKQAQDHGYACPVSPQAASKAHSRLWSVCAAQTR